MPLRIAFDLDGVLADMDVELARHAEALFGQRLVKRPPQDPTTEGAAPAAHGAEEGHADDTPSVPKLGLSARQAKRLWGHVTTIENFWETLKEIEPGAITRLATIATERRWEVIFLTRRPESAGATAQVQSQRWLEARGFTLPSVFVVQGSRGRIAAALGLDIVVDDLPENCLDVISDSRARAILVWRDNERLVPAAAKRLGIGVVKSVGDCLDIITQVDTPAAGRAGLVNRVMRLLGFNEPADA